jgi:hypothetical protein
VVYIVNSKGRISAIANGREEPRNASKSSRQGESLSSEVFLHISNGGRDNRCPVFDKTVLGDLGIVEDG